jgi:TonB family protein
MQKASIFRGVIAFACAAALTIPAFADIKAFNAAVKVGDYKTAAAEAKSTWASWDKTHTDTATMAREFGFAAYVAGDFAAARDFGQFLKEKGATLPTPDDQPAMSRVLLAAANFRLAADDNTRNALFDAMKARETAPGLDSMSLLASEALYRADWASGNWGRAKESGMLAYRLINRGGEALTPRALEARSSGAAAGFLAGRDKDDYDKIVDTHDAIIDAIDAATDPKRRETLVSLSFTVEAWGFSVFSYLNSTEQIGSNVPVKVKMRDLKRPKYAYFPAEAPSAEFNECPLSLDTTALHYPSSAAFRGMVGSVIMKFDVDAEGRITKSEVLGSVPARYFADEVLRAAPKMRAKPRKDAPVGCTIEQKNWIFTFGFRIG